MLPILTLLPAIMTVISKVATTIGPMLAKAAPTVLELAGKYLPTIIETVEKVGIVLNILKPSDSAEALGAKAMSADKKPENFESINAYVDYLHKEVSLDKTTLSAEPTDILARQAIGVAMLVKGIGETLGTEFTIPFLKIVSRLDLDANVIIEVAKAYADAGLKLDDCEKYMTKTLPIDQLDKHSEVLVNAYQKADLELSLEQAEDMIMDLELPKKTL